MNSTANRTKSSHRRVRASVVALLTAGLLATGAQGAAFAADEPAAVSAQPAGGAPDSPFDHIGGGVRDVLGRIGDLLPELPLPKNNNDWK
ncbi:hypothetical protein [Streptomyces sp. NRRL F-5727]|uniref:hypothetical protein n=1 Tax=Streptomyces sp. NRRL F-5727 TaxID=1463871 RepID=UPI0004C59FD2|nr:hypothetical protein [Streptomyces sp. NRRL F-5727]